ncbi:hypothetical protein IYW40_12140 [Methylocystis sp. H4A]|uniref:DUF5681 domain-containing protein n=1 Tax=Methylocystis sp. H4A TaxID=2785788 RepID=UPI0018C1D30A|nr:DUF5681 domain-containing protein [Methylocystis sp. H4A]MBG0802215.1 hypothetical protein [Methylocystis sp. H4A]
MTKRRADKSSTEDPSEQSERLFSDEMVDRLKSAITFGEPIPALPKTTRFQKGQSGNPKGRPKKTSSFPFHPRVEPLPIQELILKEAERGVTIREGDSVSVIPAKQAVIRALQNTALKGNPHAQRTWTLLYAPIEREKAIEIKAENEFWESYQRQCREEIKEAESKGEAPPLHLPHPDDIIIRYGKPPLFTGPTNEAELKDLEERIKLMDAFIMQIAVNERCALPENIEAGLRCADAATIFVALLNGTLPKRLQLSDTDFITKLMYFQNIPKRTLLKSTRAAWSAAGLHVPRGKIFPRLEIARAIVEGFKGANEAEEN